MKINWQKYFYTSIGLIILILINEISKLIFKHFQIKFPPVLAGLLFLFLLISTKILPLKYIEDGAKMLLSVMPLYFIGINASLILHKDLIFQNAFNLFVICALSGIVTMAVTGKILEMLLNRKDKKLQRIKK